MRVVPALVWARLRHRPLRSLLVVLGLALATAGPVVAQGSALVVAAQALRHGVAQLPVGERSLIVSYPGVVLTDAELASLDGTSRHALGQLTAVAARRQLLFRRIADTQGGSFFFGAADALTTAVRVTSGRAPASCTPTRCEVVVVGAGTPALDPSLGIVIVGRAVRTDPLLLTGTFDPGHDAPLLLADGVARAQGLSSLEQFQRSYGWVTPLDLDRVRRLGVERYVALSASVTDELYALDEGLVLTAPDNVLLAERDRAQLSARRFALLSGAGTALLLGFAVITAIGLRRDQLALVGLMRRRGASRSTTALLVVLEAAVGVGGGTVLGLLAGAGFAAAAAARAGLPALASGSTALAGALPAVAVLAVLATAVVAATSSWVVGEPGGLAGTGLTGLRGADQWTVWRVVDVAVVVGLATAILAISRGVIGTDALRGGTDPLLTALPVIAVVVGGLIAARVWSPLAGAAGRRLPRRFFAARLALLGAGHRPLRPVATVAFLAAATAIVVFAGAYRSTLAQGAVDQAVFDVPLDARVTTGTNLERPLDVQSPAGFAAAAPGATVHPVLRSSAGVRVSATESTTAEVVGVDPAALPVIRSWSHDVGGLDPAQAARLISVPAVATGLVVPAGATALSLPATGDVEQVQLVAWLREPDGRDLGVTMTYAQNRWTATLPAESTTLRLMSLTLSESPGYATRHQHAIGEGVTDKAVLSGRITLGTPVFSVASGSASATGWSGWGTDPGQSARVVDSGGQLSIAYDFTGDLVVVRAGAAAAAPAELPVLVDPATAARAPGGVLELTGSSGAPLKLRVVGVVPRFPTVGSEFVVADEAALADALDTREPGTGSVAELWVWVPDASSAALGHALGQPPYDRLTIELRAQRQADLASDPLAVGASSLLTGSALLALAVAALSLVLLVLAERRDESAELYAWESDGVPPTTLRRSLFLRALAVVVVALPAGVVTGLLLSRVTTTLVALTATGTAPRPPLVLSVGPGWAAVALLGGLLVAVVASAGVAFGALREPWPTRPLEDLR